MITIEDAARRPGWVGSISIPSDITPAGAIAEALVCVGHAMAWTPPQRHAATAWLWIDVAQRIIPGHETHNGHCPMESAHQLTPETWDLLEGAMMDLLWAHSAARNGRSSGRRVVCEQLHAARRSLRTWWEMPR